jgi:ornithine carbamoyltransferase
VVNAHTDEFHPCQLIADLLTIREHRGDLAGLTAVFLGDAACNMGNSWALAGVTAGLHVRFGAPEGCTPDVEVLARADEIAQETGGSVTVFTDPRAAVAGADVLITDTWVSMGKEEEKAAREAFFGPYALTEELVALADEAAIVLHCLPAYRDKEIAATVLDGPRSVVWDEAENRRHAQKAVITFLTEGS